MTDCQCPSPRSGDEQVLVRAHGERRDQVVVTTELQVWVDLQQHLQKGLTGREVWPQFECMDAQEQRKIWPLLDFELGSRRCSGLKWLAGAEFLRRMVSTSLTAGGCADQCADGSWPAVWIAGGPGW